MAPSRLRPSFLSGLTIGLLCCIPCVAIRFADCRRGPGTHSQAVELSATTPSPSVAAPLASARVPSSSCSCSADQQEHSRGTGQGDDWNPCTDPRWSWGPGWEMVHESPCDLGASRNLTKVGKDVLLVMLHLPCDARVTTGEDWEAYEILRSSKLRLSPGSGCEGYGWGNGPPPTELGEAVRKTWVIADCASTMCANTYTDESIPNQKRSRFCRAAAQAGDEGGFFYKVDFHLKGTEIVPSSVQCLSAG